MTATPGTEPLLRIQDLPVSFPTEDGLVQAVREVSFDVYPGEVVAIVGESGSGKSVTAMSIMRLHPKGAQMEGQILFDGTDILSLSEKEMRALRGDDIAMIFQDPMTALNPVFTVGDQIAEMIVTHRSIKRGEAMSMAEDLLGKVGVPEASTRINQYPHEFSGGMRQRAMIAMAIANEPKLLIADEPTTALDVTIQAQVMEVVRDVRELTGAAMLLITHDLGLVAGAADRIQVMYAGQIFERGTTNEIFYESQNPYTRGLMHSIPRVDYVGTRLTPIPGAPPSVLALPAGCAFRPRCTHAAEICREQPATLEHFGPTPTHMTRCHFAAELPPLEGARA